VRVFFYPSEGSLEKTISIISDTIVRNSPKLWSFYQICVVKVRIVQKCVCFCWIWLTVDIKVLKKMILLSICWYGTFFLQNLGYLGHLLHEKSFEVCIGLKSHFSGWNFVKKLPKKKMMNSKCRKLPKIKTCVNMLQVFIVILFPRKSCQILQKGKEFFGWKFLLNSGGGNTAKKNSQKSKHHWVTWPNKNKSCRIAHQLRLRRKTKIIINKFSFSFVLSKVLLFTKK